MKSINESRKKRNEKKNDDFDAFGDIVARKIRNLLLKATKGKISFSHNEQEKKSSQPW